MFYEITRWPNIYDKDAHEVLSLSWGELAELFDGHFVVNAKDLAPGFGPYPVRAPLKACRRHQDGRERLTPHRCDSCVEHLTLAVYDADKGTAEDVARCDNALAADGLARIWYTTYSHTQDKPSYRLILPLLKPVAAEVWPAFRLGALHKYRIPADPAKCSGKSHFYYLPSCKPGAEPRTLVVDGKPLDPSTVALTHAPQRMEFATLAGFEWEPPPEPTGPVDVAELRAVIMAKAMGFVKKGEKAKAEWLRRLFNGEVLAEKGGRNEAAFKVAGMLAWALPGKSVGTLMYLMRPSVDAMIDAGSSLNHDKVERMLLTAMRNKAEADYLAEQSQKNRQQELDAFRAALFKSAGVTGKVAE